MTTQALSHPAHRLLAESAEFPADAGVQVLEGGAGQLAEAVAARVPAGWVVSLTRDWRELTAAQALLEDTPNAEASGAAFALPDRPTDLVLMSIPKGRYLSRALLASAWTALRDGGALYLAGPSKMGAKSVINDARSLFGNAEVMGYKSHQRVARCVKDNAATDAPAWAGEPGVANGTFGEFTIDSPAGLLTFRTRPGVFSWDGLDEGTALLLEHLEIADGESVWDVGCGCGVIGLWAAQAGARVLMSDIDLIALACARGNVAFNRLDDRVEVAACDGLRREDGRAYDLIVTNPAFHQGRDRDTAMAENLIRDASGRLAPGGRLVIVANRFLGYAKALKRAGFEVGVVTETSRYRVFEGVAGGPEDADFPLS